LKLSPWWTGVCSPPAHPLQAPLPALRRRLEAAADRNRVASTATRLPRGSLRGYYESYYDSTRLLRGYYEATTRLLRGNAATTWLLRGCYETTTRPLPGYYEATTRLLPGAARTPLGQQHSSGSTARLPAPLTPATRSWRRRSAHQWKDARGGRSPHMPNKLDNSEDQACHISSCSRMQLVCSPACTPTSPTKTSTRQASRP
jgi:hypothetical protein